MNLKEQMRTALERRLGGSPVPVWELEFHCWDAASGRHVVLGDEFAALTPAEQDRALGANAEILAAVCEELSFAALTAPGNRWEIAPGKAAYWWLPPEARIEQIRRLKRLVGDRLMLVAATGGVMAMPGAAEYVEFCYQLMDAPEAIEERARKNLAGGLKTAAVMRDLGVDAVFTASDIADNRGPFFNPEQLERLIFPCLREWAAGVRKLGMLSIIHTDGNVAPCLEGIASSGVDAMQAIDPTAGMDLRRTLDAVQGRICLCGNVSCADLLTGTPESVAAATRKLLADCAGTGFVLGASNAVDIATPIGNYRAMIGAWREHAKGSKNRRL
ncbi:MAG TPA: uroporphyrinogen decarboxylase family protein [Planctomycetota bacterium]|nr:uroporphyrinogen decarboxylase family protein [Planctomycetota bacterium]